MRVTCGECGTACKLVDSKVVYGRSYGPIWKCPNCGAFVGCHKNSKQNAPLGIPAGNYTRMWRANAHAVFDPLWKAKAERDGLSRNVARSEAYEWLGRQMNLPPRECHIARLNAEQCKRVVAICKPYAKALGQPSPM